ncbi:MAG TPA: sugar ABC transporter substrate-binding protein [Vicinamibacteria bacterium]|nr:sugar ABC transporter substrate-binding protein [Vicinamibacteria bacterium]
MTKSKRTGRAALAGAAALVAACTSPADDARRAQTPRVALVLKTLNSPFFIEMEKGAQEAAQRLGVDLTVQAAEREVDVDKQMQIIENLIQTGVKVLVVAPAGSKEIVPAIAKANAAGIRVVVVDTRVDAAAAADAGITIDTYIGSDNYEGGKLAGRHLVEVTGGKARVGVLEGIPGHETGDQRLRGFKDAIEEAPGVKIVASQTANWERDQGFNVFQNMLEAHPEIDAVFSANDMMALGAVEAIAARGRTGTIKVVGYDAVDDAKKAIADGAMVASVAQFPFEMGRVAVESAHKLLQGQAVPPEQLVRIDLVTKLGPAPASAAAPAEGGRR